tara:strand:- start:2063 stop:3061 length:999 start_codon:yes stop_codon:yes gene_type:complete
MHPLSFATTASRRGAALCVAAALTARLPQPATAKSRTEGYALQSIDGREWIDVLSSGQYFVLRTGGTEPPNSSPLYAEKRRGVYVCAGCVAPLFDSTQKFESGTGWPSFAQPRSGVEVVGSLVGSEVRCGRCGGHLGDVFGDGAKFPGTPAAITGRRFCIDGAAMVFVPSEQGAGPVAGDGLTGRARIPPARRSGAASMCAPSEPLVDKQMTSSELVTLAEVTPEFRILMEESLAKLDQKRRLDGKPKYVTIEAMIDSYVEEAAKEGLGWTREDAESEVVRFLKRRALRDEGAPGQNPDDVFIGIVGLIVIWAAVAEFAPLQDLPAAVISPY